MIPKKPMDSTWTDEQWQAIYQSGSNIIVSAGAGSGKTAVLTERIIEKLKQGISISSLVVLTFTKSAAFEMKTRVRNKIQSEIQNGNLILQKELEQLDSANITTFDSYSLSLVKKYHYLLGIPKNIGIADDVLLNQIKKEVMDEVFNFFYEKNDPSFLRLLDTFTTKDDQSMKQICLKLSDALESLVHKREYLSTYLKTYYQEKKIQDRIKQYERLLEKEKTQIFDFFQKFKENATHPISLEMCSKLESSLNDLFKSDTYNDYHQWITELQFLSFTRSQKIDPLEKETLKELYDQIKTRIDRLSILTSYPNEDALFQSILNTKDTVSILISILLEYDHRLFKIKEKESYYEFSDIARLAITLLEKHPEICTSMKKEIKEIMIDEYQDTNDIGDYFISLISNHNVYMVGDIKQSIYRFRNANPSIFMDKYNRYKDHQDGEKIDLNKNFRSRKEVLEDINFLFEKIMDEEIGGANYKVGHAMVFGNLLYEKEKNKNQNYHFEILDYEYQEKYKNMYRQEEVEAFLIAQDIKTRIEKKEQILDKKTKQLRNIRYNDFAILLDRKTSFDLFKKIFTYLEIPLTVHKDEDFVYSDEIFVIQNIFKWINSLLNINSQNELRYAVFSVGRSFLLDVSDQDLFFLLKEDLKGLEDPSNPMYEVSEKMKFLASYSKEHTLSQLLEKIYERFDFYHQILKLQNIEFLNIKLDYLLDITRNLEMLGYQIKDFIQYLECAIEGTDVTFQRNLEQEANAVSIMTIHKSKGLEYPVCYYALLGKKFSKEELKERFLFDLELGFLVPYFEEGLRETFYKELLKSQYQKADISERLRVFYVALTRAKEKLILVTNLCDAEDCSFHDFVDTNTRLTYQSFYDILKSLKTCLKPYRTSISLDHIGLTKQYEQIKKNNYQELLTPSSKSFSYFDIQIEKKEIVEQHFSKSDHKMSSKKQELLNLGNRLHECLQYSNPNTIDDDLKKSNFTIFEQKKIQAFFNQPFWAILQKPCLYHELEFIEQGENRKHGVIDLLIVDSDCTYVIDYKLKNIDKESYFEQIKGYMKMVRKKVNTPVVGILYSLLEETYQEIQLEANEK